MKSQSATEISIILFIIILLSSIILGISGIVGSFSYQSSEKTNELFQNFDIGISQVEIGEYSGMQVQNNFNYNITILNITGIIGAQNYVVYNSTVFLDSKQSKRISPLLLDFNCSTSELAEIYFSIHYIDVFNQNTSTDLYPLYKVSCN